MMPTDFSQSLLVPLVATDARYHAWQHFAVRALPLSLALSLSLVAACYFLYQQQWLAVLVSLFALGACGGILHALNTALKMENQYITIQIAIYQRNVRAYRLFVQQINIDTMNIQARKGSSVNIGGEVQAQAGESSGEQVKRFAEHFIEFYDLVTTGKRDIARGWWIKEGEHSNPYQWKDGHPVHRSEYDGCTKMLEYIQGVKGRTKGYKGELQKVAS